MIEFHQRSLQKALELMGDKGVRTGAADYLHANAAAVSADLTDTVLSEIKAFSDSRNREVMPQLAEHGPQHLLEICRLLRTAEVGSFEFVADHAKVRAKQHFPLEATLHAYRCGHKVYASWLRSAMQHVLPKYQDHVAQISAAADFALEYTDAASTILTEQYIAQTRLMADVAIDRRSELMGLLLQGYDESDGRIAGLLREAGFLDERQSYCVVAARSVDPIEMTNLERVQRLTESLNELLVSESGSQLINLRDGRVVSIVSDSHRVSGWTRAKPSLSRRVTNALLKLGNAVLVGISHDVQATSSIPNAFRESLLALQIASVSKRVVCIADLSVRDIMLQASAQEVLNALPEWAEPFSFADDKSGGVLSDTLRAYADANMNVLKAGARLGVHANTVYFRLQKIKELTGLDARSFHKLSELLLVADCRSD